MTCPVISGNAGCTKVGKTIAATRAASDTTRSIKPRCRPRNSSAAAAMNTQTPLTSALPPHGAHANNGVSTRAKASFDQGKPPKGSRARSCSTPTQASGAQTSRASPNKRGNRGMACSPRTHTCAKKQINSVSRIVKAIHGKDEPAETPVQVNCGPKKPSPHTADTNRTRRPSLPRLYCQRKVPSRIMTEGISNSQRFQCGKARAPATPPKKARGRAIRSPTSPLPV